MEKFNIENPLQKTEKEKKFFISDIVKRMKEFFPDNIKTAAREARAFWGEGWKKKSFDLEKKLNSVKGPLIEVGGPTEGGYNLIDTEKLEKKLYVSNIFPGCRICNRTTGQFMGYYGKVDFMADGRRLPLKDGTIGALFASCVGGIAKSKEYDGRYNDDLLREKIFEEAMRILEPGGIMVMQGAHKENYEYAKKLGFELVQQAARDKRLGKIDAYRNCIFEKPGIDDDQEN